MSPRRPLLLLSVAAVLALALGAQAGTKATPAPAAPAPSPPPSEAIPVAEVATRAADAANVLRRLTDPLAPSVAIDAIRARLPELRAQIDDAAAEATRILAHAPTLDVLQA